MNVTQTIEIPAQRAGGRRLTIDIPPEVPEGTTILEFRPVTKTPASETVGDAKKAESATPNLFEEMLATLPKEQVERIRAVLAKSSPHTEALFGLLEGMGPIDLDEIRTERIMSRYLKHSK